MKKNLSKTVKASIFFLALLFSLSAAKAATGILKTGSSINQDLSVDGSGTGWEWNATTETLTLSEGFVDYSYISFKCQPTDHVKIKLNADISTTCYLLCDGSLTIDADGYTFEFTATSIYGIKTVKDLFIVGGNVDILWVTNIGIQCTEGSLNISGNANVNAKNGINVNETLNINTTGVVSATGVHNVVSAADFEISSGTLLITASSHTGVAMSINNGISITGTGNVTCNGNMFSPGNINIDTEGTVNVEILGYWGMTSGSDINISNGTIDVSVGSHNIAIEAAGAINVSGGEVTVAGGTLFSGILNHTGGTINGQGPPTVPAVATGAINNITSETAMVTGAVTNNGGSDIILCKIMYKVDGTTIIREEFAETPANNFTIQLKDLEPNTNYLACAAAHNNEGWGFGEWKTFSTSVSSVDEWRMENGEWRIYPNPTCCKLRMENGEWRISGVEIYNLNGRMVKRIDNPSSEIDVSDLQHGIYFVKIKTEKGEVVRKLKIER